jgi:chorismate mutase/prephenate dehydratase
MNLNNLREEIDNIDNNILKLLEQRMQIVKSVGELKHKSGGSIYRPEREQEILDRLKNEKKGIINSEAIEAIYLEIFAASRNLELPERVAYLGPEGSFTHQVAESRFGAYADYLSLNGIEAIFKILENKEAKYGVVPIENNTDGIVGITLDCLGKYNSKIVAEFIMDIHHSFASLSDSLSGIKRIYSHPQGYNQCRMFLEEHILLDLEFVPTRSTAEAAKMALNDPKSAAICSKIAAKMYRLPILFDRIEDNLANKTRFLILSDFKNKRAKKNKTSILAKTKDEPGSLVKFLQRFEQEAVNLTKIESRPLKNSSFETVFYLDFEGYIDDEKVQNVLRGDYEIKWLGSYSF